MNEAFCPHCQQVKTHKIVSGCFVPEPDAIAVCCACAGIHVFDNSLRLREPTTTEKENYNWQAANKFRLVVLVVNQVRADMRENQELL